MIETEPLQHIAPTYVRFRGRKLTYFSGCDYFRLSSHPRVVAALTTAALDYGINVAASRLTTGNHPIYIELERTLAGYFGADDALLVPDGYLTNLVVAQALSGNFSHSLLDEKAHPSLVDAAGLLGCPVVRFGHRQLEHVANAVRRCGPGARLILLTDGLFSHDGNVAPLKDYARVLPKDSLMLVDDAHGAGILGRTGKGSLEYAGLARTRVIQTITLSKAFGVYGGAILHSRAFRKTILERSRIFVGSTPMPPPLAKAAVEAVALLSADKGRRQRLEENNKYLKERLRGSGYPTAETPGPVLAVRPKNAQACHALHKALLRLGIYPPYLCYPGGEAGGYFRFAISSEHSRRQLDQLLDVLTRLRPASV